jgi:hypothetical protein
VRRSATILSAVAAAVIVGAAGAAAAADPAPTLAPQEELEPKPAAEDAVRENPWSQGVPEAERRAADALFQEGNALMRESITLSAAAKYREALTHWDHPNVHFNLAVALISLDQPVETYEHLQQAIRYGPGPLQQERYDHARNYLRLLEQQLAHVEVRCAVAGASVELDGRPLFTAPGSYQGLARAGRHTVVARREGLVTNQSVRVLEGGQTHVIDLELKTLEELTEHHRRWDAWKPWAVVGAGAAVVLTGGALHYAGAQKIQEANRRANEECSTGCPGGEPPDVKSLRQQGTNMQQAAIAAYAVGGATLVVGSVLAYLNRDQTRVRPYDTAEPGAPAPRARIELSPFAAPGAPGVSVAVRF